MDNLSHGAGAPIYVQKLVAFTIAKRNGHRPYTDEEWMRSRYEDQGMTLRQIAREANCSLRTIARWLNIHGIATRDKLQALRLATRRGTESPHWKGGPKPCLGCGGAKSVSARHCVSCSYASRRGAGNSNWRGLADVMVLVRQWSSEYWRPRVFERDKYVCQHCGDSQGGNLNAHHLTPLSVLVRVKKRNFTGELNDEKGRLHFVKTLLADTNITTIKNGITLCNSCHREVHAQMHIPAPKKSHGRKLPLQKRSEVKYLYASKRYTQKELGQIFRVSQSHISRIVRS